MSVNREGESTLFQTILSCIIFFGTIAIVVFLVFLNKRPAQQPDEKKAPLVEFVAIEPYSQKVTINVTGVSLPFREVTMMAEVTGGVTDKAEECRAGTYVKKGTHLLSIDSEKYRLAKERTAKEIEDAKARRDKVKLELANAKTVSAKLDQDLQFQEEEEARRKQLYEENAISKTEYRQSQRNLIAAQNASSNQNNKVATLVADLKVQENSIELKDLQHQEALIDFNKATINAPADGVVISDDVQKDDFVSVGKALLVFEDTSAIEVKCDLRSDQLQSILQGQQFDSSQQNRFDLPRLPATIRYEANGITYEWEGELDRYDGLGLDEKTRTAPVRIVVKDTLAKSKDKTLVRGMYVSVELDLGKRSGLLALPAEAVRAGNEVWLYDSGNLKKTKVKVVDRILGKDNKEVVVAKANSDTVQAGMLLIVTPIPQPIDGMELRTGGSDDKKSGNKSGDNGKDQESNVKKVEGQTKSSTANKKTASLDGSSKGRLNR